MKRLVLLMLVVAPFAVVSMGRSEPGRHAHAGLSPRFPALRGSPRSGAGGEDRGRRAHEPRIVEVQSLPKATAERAERDARARLGSVVTPWLAEAGVPADWTPPTRLIDALARDGSVKKEDRDYGTVYIKTLRVDLGESHREEFMQAYRRDVAGRRLLTLGEVLGFVLVCLGIVTGYIRADEATRGYYTGPLRLVAVGGLGLAGFALVRMLS
jgi:hypothetical protein